MRAAIALVTLALVSPTFARKAPAPASLQHDVHHRGVAVMRFDQDRTMHTFRPTPTGSVQSVISTDGDPMQIA